MSWKFWVFMALFNAIIPVGDGSYLYGVVNCLVSTGFGAMAMLKYGKGVVTK